MRDDRDGESPDHTRPPAPPRPDREWDGHPPSPDGAEPGPSRAPWRAIEAIPVFFIALVAGTIIGLPFNSLSCTPRFIALELAGEIGFFGATVAWVRYVDKAPLAALGAPRKPLLDLGAGAAAGLVLVLLGGIVLFVSQVIARAVLGHTPTEPQQVESCVRGLSVVFLAPVVVLAAPIGEETFFRGFLYNGLRRRFSPAVAAVISGLAFGLVHFAALSFLLIIPGLFVIGIGLALVYEWRQSLLASMAAHATFNLVGFLVIAHGRL
jgi:membrane protease YdiL (CAAX protease family)